MQCEKCQSESLKFVKYKIEGGGVQIRRQCTKCGYVLMPSLKKSNFTQEEYDNMLYLNEELREQYYENQKLKREQQYQEHRQEGFDRLNEYYNSPEWQEKRIQRLRLNEKLFDGWCERCGKMRAMHVHHRSYASIDGFEHPFDLECLCEQCHKKLHPHMEEN